MRGCFSPAAASKVDHHDPNYPENTDLSQLSRALILEAPSSMTGTAIAITSSR